MYSEYTKLTSKVTGSEIEVNTNGKYEILTKLIHRVKVFKAKRNMDKVPAIEITKMGGLKCDNPSCDWADMSIPSEDYKRLVNARCPKCGENILTVKDYEKFKCLMKFIKVINFILPKRKITNTKDLATMSIEFDGNGRLDTKIEKL